MGATAIAALTTGAATAQEFTLRMHQFLPAQANVPRDVLDVWADNVERDSGGRIEIERYASMALGGTPPELMDQAMDGIADIIWTVNGYTPGRFPQTEVFELPFMVSDARAASSALWTMYEEHMQEDFAGVHMLAMWVHGPGMFHTNRPIVHPSDLQGMKIRGGSRGVNDLLALVGAEAVGLPVSGVPEALSRGVIDGTTIPWEVTSALHVSELVHNHTEIEGPALYVLTFSFAMNQDTYDSLPADLQEVIDNNSGLEFSIFAGGTQADADGPARQVAVDLGNNIVTVSEADAQEWVEVVQPLYATWVEDMNGRGIDGQALIDEARQLMSDYEAAN
ncbi:TRAP transporter substrate-binding protein [Pararhodobacter zhoushanensis]|uniref:TRAP transporter substrate-binding protein n=2 Tax=Pararhodobacter zhoushanensis TaxID=2479545 RepID=A0ABT3GTU8_9RHOB|nr:TRAP transporter substrate-binding protein [Pararhodobacter zhoushanensis]MCW1930957.1 TRAP transporter substrate-binding protein [Pararhodobacter zhoushanensis]